MVHLPMLRKGLIIAFPKPLPIIPVRIFTSAFFLMTKTAVFLGMIDDVRLYGKAFGSEDVQHLYRGDPIT